MLVVSDEIIAMARRILRGFEVDDATLATEVISEVGPAGQFLDHPHTAERFRREFWFPRLMDRSRYDSWNAGGRHTLLQRARQRLSRILAEHHAPQLPARAAEAIGSILTEREKKEAKAAP
jgi:trimethylamine--corrinoid protein Co-methyltransferase